MRIPILILSDGPNLASGLARIARDIAYGLWNNREKLGIDLAQLGFDYDGSPMPWPCRAVRDGENWAEGDIVPAWYSFFGARQGAVFTVWDPARCFGLSRNAADIPVQLWGYFALDAESANSHLSGPAAETLRRYRRVLAYGRFGATLIERAIGTKPISYLPHGLDLSSFRVWHQLPALGAADTQTEEIKPAPLKRVMIGAVAANIGRKDFPLLFDAWARMRDRRPDLIFWLHTNSEVGPAWSVPELADQFGFGRNLLVTGTKKESFNDKALASLYSQCLATIAPGLGEGFGYPIVESLACGTPVVAIDYAGGAELVPRADWKVAPSAWRYESVHVLKRPVVSPQAVANAALAAAACDDDTRAYCAGSVAHLDWSNLWPYWEATFMQWLQELRT